MRTVSRVVIATIASFVFMPVAFSASQPTVATLLNVQGKAFVESIDGVRQVARKGMQVGNGSNLLVLEKTKVDMSYATSGCKVTHGADTLVAVLESAQCAPGQQMSVGAGAAGAAERAGAAYIPSSAGLSLSNGGLGKVLIPLGAVLAVGIVANNDGGGETASP